MTFGVVHETLHDRRSGVRGRFDRASIARRWTPGAGAGPRLGAGTRAPGAITARSLGASGESGRGACSDQRSRMSQPRDENQGTAKRPRIVPARSSSLPSITFVMYPSRRDAASWQKPTCPPHRCDQTKRPEEVDSGRGMKLRCSKPNATGPVYSNRTLSGSVMRPSNGSVAPSTPAAATKPTARVK